MLEVSRESKERVGRVTWVIAGYGRHMKVTSPSHPSPHQKRTVFKMCAFTPPVSTPLEGKKTIAIAFGPRAHEKNTLGAGRFLDATWCRRPFAVEPDVDASKDPRRVGQGKHDQPMEET